MNILFLCGYYEDTCQIEILEKTKATPQNAANGFQKRLIQALHGKNNRLEIISAPFIGTWPQHYADVYFRGFRGEMSGDVRYVQFCNVWGWRNLSRARALKKAVREYVMWSKGEPLMIVVYSAHTPLMEAAVYAKKLDAQCRICLVVPDLPWYMNLNKKPHPAYDFFKKMDIRRVLELNKHMDSYILLTKHMAEPMQVGDRPYIVVEGISGSRCQYTIDRHDDCKKVTYAGTLDKAFGIRRLLNAFRMFEEDVSLELFGNGDMKDEIIELSRSDRRIHYHGMVSDYVAAQKLRESDVLVNPRLNNEAYTKYSFPSKTIEYLNSGNAVVAYMLDGMPECYRDYLFVPEDDSTESLYSTLKRALDADSSEVREKFELAQEYFQNVLSPEKLRERLMQLWLQ